MKLLPGIALVGFVFLCTSAMAHSTHYVERTLVKPGPRGAKVVSINHTHTAYGWVQNKVVSHGNGPIATINTEVRHSYLSSAVKRTVAGRHVNGTTFSKEVTQFPIRNSWVKKTTYSTPHGKKRKTVKVVKRSEHSQWVSVRRDNPPKTLVHRNTYIFRRS